MNLPPGRGRRLLAGGAGDVTTLDSLKAGELYSLVVWLKDPATVAGAAEIQVRVEDAAGLVLEKTLHAGDLDLYLTLRPRADGAGGEPCGLARPYRHGRRPAGRAASPDAAQ